MLLPFPPREVFWASCSSLHEGRRNRASSHSLPYTRHLAMPFRVTFSRPSQAERLMHCPLPRFAVAGLPRLIGTGKELAHLNPVLTCGCLQWPPHLRPRFLFPAGRERRFARSRLVLGAQAHLRARAAGQRRGQRFCCRGWCRQSSSSRPRERLIKFCDCVAEVVEAVLALALEHHLDHHFAGIFVDQVV